MFNPLTVEQAAALVLAASSSLLGRQNIKSFETQDTSVEFGLRAMRMVVDLNTLTVGRLMSEDHPYVMSDSVTRVFQKSLRKKVFEILQAAMEDAESDSDDNANDGASQSSQLPSWLKDKPDD